GAVFIGSLGDANIWLDIDYTSIIINNGALTWFITRAAMAELGKVVEIPSVFEILWQWRRGVAIIPVVDITGHLNLEHLCGICIVRIFCREFQMTILPGEQEIVIPRGRHISSGRNRMIVKNISVARIRNENKVRITNLYIINLSSRLVSI